MGRAWLEVTDAMVKALRILQRVGPSHFCAVHRGTLSALRRRRLVKGDEEGRVILSERGLAVLKERGDG